jgi:hypothetical protein
VDVIVRLEVIADDSMAAGCGKKENTGEFAKWLYSRTRLTVQLRARDVNHLQPLDMNKNSPDGTQKKQDTNSIYIGHS